MTAVALTEARRAYRWSCALADTLVDRRRRFDGDLDQYLLYMTVVQAEVERSFRPLRAGAGLNALSLAETCGLARETARTKLRRMTEAGVLAMSETGLLHLPDPDAAHREYGALDPIAVPRP
jgi:hypothetical protein